MNKKVILLAGAALFTVNTANAMDWGMDYYKDVTFNPYIGLDYAFSHANYNSDNLSKPARDTLKDEYHSGAVNFGVRPNTYFGLEGFYQQSGERKGADFRDVAGNSHKVKSEFYAYGLDAYGYMPIGCNGFSLLGTAGVANYNFKVKYRNSSDDSQKVGYRAGVGAQYEVDDHWSVRVVGRYSYVDSKYLDNLQEVTAGLRYSF